MKTIISILLLCSAIVSRGNDYKSTTTFTEKFCKADTIPNVVLPVTIVSFSGNLVKNYIKLDWTYADEAESRDIVIERSTGNEGFKSIGEINITTIPSHIRSYSFIDSFPAEGMNRYRLKFLYPDDVSQRSFIISIEGKETGLAVQSVYPNPFREQISVQWHSESAETVVVRLLDMNGRVAFQTSLASVKGNNNYSVGGLDKLVPGYYAMQIVTSAGVLQQKLVKSR